MVIALAGEDPAGAISIKHPAVVAERPVDWTPHLNGEVSKILDGSDRVYLGGSFTKVRNATSTAVQPLSYLVAVDKATHNILPQFKPQLNGPARGLVAARDGHSIYVVGNFSRVNGRAQHGVARLDAITGASWPGFHPSEISGEVNRLDRAGTHLIIGGSFQSVAGVPRRGLASLDAATGAATSYVNLALAGSRVVDKASGSVKVADLAVSPDGSRLVVIGDFTTVAGQLRHQLAVINLSANSATLANWSTDRYKPRCWYLFPSYVRGVAISPNSRYFVVTTSGGGASPETLCDSVARFELTTSGTGIRETWANYAGGDTLLSAAITGPVVYVGGHQRWLNNRRGNNFAMPGAVSRPGIGALDSTRGHVLAWNPTKDRGVGVADICPTAEGLWIGSDTDHVHGTYHGKVAFFPL